MSILGFFGLTVVAVGAYWWLLLARLRTLSWWDGFAAELWRALEVGYAYLRKLCGHSRTLAVAYAAELLGILDEARLLDWSELVGAERAGRVMVVMGAMMIVLRLVTCTAVSFRAEG